MGISEQIETLEIPQYTITAQSDLEMIVLKGVEGIGNSYTTKLTFEQCAKFLDIEDESIPALQRLQRDADKPRVKNIVNYLMDRDNTIFSSACLIVTELELESIHAGSTEVFKAVLPAGADRLAVDGQGRISSIKQVILDKPELAAHHLDVKIIVVPTNTVRESAEFVSQIFADLNSAKNPNTSQNVYFDNEKSSSRLAKELLKNTVKMGFGEAVAVNGKLEDNQLYTLANFIDFIQIFTGEKSKAKLNETLDDEQVYKLNLMLISQYLTALYKHLPLADIQTATDISQRRESCVLTCAIGFKALAYVGHSLVEDMLVKESTSMDVDGLSKITDLPLFDRKNKVWADKEIYQMIEGKLKIIRASEKRLARMFCHKMRLMPSEVLS